MKPSDTIIVYRNPSYSINNLAYDRGGGYHKGLCARVKGSRDAQTQTQANKVAEKPATFSHSREEFFSFILIVNSSTFNTDFKIADFMI